MSNTREFGFSIEAATERDILAAIAIEQAALEILFGHPAYALFSGHYMSAEELRTAIVENRWWVARHAGVVAGHVLLDRMGEDAYLAQMDVDPAWGRRGIGRAMLEHVCEQACMRGFRAIVLITLRDVPWNAPFYEKSGFVEVPPQAWSVSLRRQMDVEASLGFPMALRVPMRRELVAAL